MTTQVKKKPLSKEAKARKLAEQIFGMSMMRLSEIIQTQNPPPPPAEIRKMIQRRVELSFDGAQAFIDSWDSIGKGRFAPKD